MAVSKDSLDAYHLPRVGSRRMASVMKEVRFVDREEPVARPNSTLGALAEQADKGIEAEVGQSANREAAELSRLPTACSPIGRIWLMLQDPEIAEHVMSKSSWRASSIE